MALKCSVRLGVEHRSRVNPRARGGTGAASTLVILSLAPVVGPQFGSRAIAQEATSPTGEAARVGVLGRAADGWKSWRGLWIRSAAASAAATPDVAEVDRITSEPIDEARNAVASADNDTVEAVTATYRESSSCLNAGDYVRVYALYTDDYLRRHFAEGARQLENFQATPVPEDERIVDQRRVRAVAR